MIDAILLLLSGILGTIWILTVIAKWILKNNDENKMD